MSNCRSLDGSSQLQCFVQGLSVVQDCADTRNYPTELAPAMLAAGRGTDGQEGSLCTAVLVGAGAASNKRAPLPTAYHLLCKGLNLLSLPSCSPVSACPLRQAAATRPSLCCQLM